MKIAPRSLTLLCAAVFALSAFVANANENWYQQPAISPDGKSIIFSAKGDIYRVSTQGGQAVPIVSDSSWDGYPVWSHDGTSIAFASDRNGSLDVYHLALQTNTLTRLTYHSANDFPTEFTPDNQSVHFNSARMPSVTSSDFPTRALAQLYSVNVNGGTPQMLLTTSSMQGKTSSDDKQFVYMDNKGYENSYRKHDVSSFARDIWLLEKKTGEHKQLTNFAGGDSNPVWGEDGVIYYLSEDETNNFNVWKMDTKGNNKIRVTQHQTHPVRSLSRADEGLLAYAWHGDLFVLQDGKKPQKLDVSLLAEKHNLSQQALSVSNKANRFSLSPNGKEVAFIARGELFVTSIEFGTTVRLTNTPEQERGISWFPDGRTIAFAAEKDGSWGIYQVAIADEAEPYFFAATKFTHTPLITDSHDAFQPRVSPDGKSVAYIKNRDEISVFHIDKNTSNTVFSEQLNYSYSDGDISFDWSPDSRWIVATYIPRGFVFYTDLGIAPADGSELPVDITLSGYADVAPQWGENGAIQFVSGRFGRRNHGSWGNDFDIMSVFLTQTAYDDFLKNKEERTLADERQTDAEKENKDEDTDKDSKEKAKAVTPITIEWEDLQMRTVRLTKHSSDFDGNEGMVYGLTAEGDKLYYLAKFEKGFDLWVEDFKEKSTKLAVKLNAKHAFMQMDKKGENAVILADGALYTVALSGDHEKKSIAYSGSINLDESAERAYLFDHIWRQTQDKFYNPDMHGIDWKRMYDAYYEKAVNTQNNYDFSIITSELLGELNASHTGTYYRFIPSPPASTSSLGVIYADVPTRKGILIEEILPKSPLTMFSDLVKEGSLLTHVDGQAVNLTANVYQRLNGKAGQRTRLTLVTQGKVHEVVVKPTSIGEEQQALYVRWVDSRRALVDKMSKGTLGYVHIPQMDDAAYRTTYAELFGRTFDKKAVVVDTRFNRGGWLTDDLVTLLSGKQYTWEVAGGIKYKGDSMKRWAKPSIVVMNEGNYSDGYCFPKAYTMNNIGKTVGMPVPGTCTAVWWEALQTEDLVFGIPQMGVADIDGNFLENNQLEPDIKVKNTPEDTKNGKDAQLEKAVEVLMQMDSA
ncbi:S41 family peptidase [Alteromonas sp. 14N.309.X.WAT.G.H12]|uniref:S41 family peptidase n=1 Tax=Alteromonas sp. 14N.309.X.WAT.G.H12 TaxID=3120824 RepID=UPI002FD42AD3